MRHIILGAGNLGLDIALELGRQKKQTHILTGVRGWIYPMSSLVDVYNYFPDHVWITLGAGSVEQANANFAPFIDLHIKLVTTLAKTLPAKVHLHVFSTDYVADPERPEYPYSMAAKVNSLYALSKKTMEEALELIEKPNTHIYRVGSLYGTHKPLECFPCKLKQRSLLSNNNEIKLPVNSITPTPTDWLANTLIANLNTITTEELPVTKYHVAPKNNVTVARWGEYILKTKVKSNGIDYTRPSSSKLGCSFPNDKTWLDLWLERDQIWTEILKKVT